MVASTAVYIYYTILIYLTPFLNQDSKILAFFPSKYWAMALPVYCGVFLVSIVMLFIGIVFLFSDKKENTNTPKKEN